MAENFDVEVCTFAKVCSSSGDFPKYFIPHYQRGYSWGKDEIIDLLDDIKEAVNSQPSGYFVGPITILLNDATRRDEVIDGQQRLTTISLIVSHLSSVLLESEAHELKEASRKYLVFRNDRAVVEHLRRDDRKAFYELLTRVPTSVRTNFDDAHSIIEQYFQRDDFIETEIANYLGYLCDKVTFIVVTCLDDDMSYQIFETLNDRGKGLSPLDLIRNKIFSNIENEALLEETLKDWDELYSVLKAYANGKNADGHIQILFSIVLALRGERWLEPKKLFPALKTYLADKTDQSNASVELVKYICSDISTRSYLRLCSPSQAGNSLLVENSLRDFNQYKILGPLIYSLFIEGHDDHVTSSVINMAGALIKRTQVLGNIPGLQYGQLFTDIGNAILGQNVGAQIIADAREAIIEHDRSTKGKLVLNDDEFITRIVDLPNIKEDRARDIFISLYNAKKEPATQRLSASADLHIEHVLPQTHHQSNWPNFDIDMHKNCVQRLGNLMLLSGSRNSKVGQRPYSEKLELYQANEGNDYWKVAFIDGVNEWTEDSIKNRQNEIAKELVKVWHLNY